MKRKMGERNKKEKAGKKSRIEDWPLINPKSNLKVTHLKDSHLFTVCLSSSMYMCMVFSSSSYLTYNIAILILLFMTVCYMGFQMSICLFCCDLSDFALLQLYAEC